MSKSPSLRRIQADIRELKLDPSDRYHAAPLEHDMFEWHFTIRGADGTDFAGGIYHGRILLPPEYPFKPPNIIFLNASGRFETNTKICLSFSAFHPELWQPAWGIRLILEALISFLPTPADGAIGALDWSSKERKRLAKQSIDWCCPVCGKIADLLPQGVVENNNNKTNRFQKEIEHLQRLQSMEQKHSKSEESSDTKQQENGVEQMEKDLVAAVADDDDNNDENAEMQKAMGLPVVESTSTEEHASERNEPQLSPQPTDSTPLPCTEETVPTSATQHQEENYIARMIDPVLHIAILLLSTICLLLIRKVRTLLAELKELDEE